MSLSETFGLIESMGDDFGFQLAVSVMCGAIVGIGRAKDRGPPPCGRAVVLVSEAAPRRSRGGAKNGERQTTPDRGGDQGTGEETRTKRVRRSMRT